MTRRAAVRAAILLLTLGLSDVSRAQLLRPAGPAGGDVRSLAADPRNTRVLYLGTSDGHLFTSHDGGLQWTLLSRVGEGRDTVVMTLLVDQRTSRRLYAGTWSLSGSGGGLYQSDDQGRTWRLAGLRGTTVRMLVQSATHPDVLVAATLQGVFRSRDAGKQWELLTPSGHEHLRNFDSVAIDPADPQIIYAGTYHLAWKTVDGGRNWLPIHRGMIDDSDVMDIEIDPRNPERIFATACSGMYRSENRGEMWTKIRGVPPSARRTHFIQQDPQRPQTLYAGTTQGLWKSADDGLSWRRMTPAEWSIIGLVIDAKNPDRLVLGTERRGIQISENGGTSFRAANEGFHHQQVVSFAMDRVRPERMLLVLTNSAQPVLATSDGGQTWAPLGGGLRVEELRGVYAAGGTWLATLQRGGLLQYDTRKAAWARIGVVKDSRPAPRATSKSRAVKGVVPGQAGRPLSEIVYDLAYARDYWLAATHTGLLVSRDLGATWSPLDAGSAGKVPVHSVHVSPDGSRIRALASRALLVSRDTGQTWSRQPLTLEVHGETRLHETGESGLAITSARGLFLSPDGGNGWRQAPLPQLSISDFAVVEDVYIVSTRKGGLYLSRDRGQSWSRIEETREDHFPFLKRIGESATLLAASSTEGLRVLELKELRARAQADSERAGTN